MSGLTTNQDLDPAALRQAFGVFPSGVVAVAAVIDTGAEGVPVGLAASSFTSVSLDPPLVSFSVAKTSKTWPQLRQAAHLGISVLAEHQDRVCRALAGPVEDRFTDLAISVTDGGAILLDEGLAHFECTIYREVDAGDHLLVLLRLHSVGHIAGQPLVFHRSAFARLTG